MTSPRRGIQRWSTDDVPAAMKFDYWAIALSQAVIPMSVSSQAKSLFHAEQTSISLGPLAVIRNHGTAHESWRSKRDVERSQDCSYHLLMSRGGEWRIRHRGAHQLSRGELILTDSRYEHWLGIDTDYDIVNLKIPVDWLKTWVPDPDVLVGHPIGADCAWGRPLSAVVSQLIPESLEQPALPPTVLAEQVGALLAIAAGEVDCVDAAERALRARIEQAVHDRCHEPGLVARDIAQQLCIPEAVVHRALGAANRTYPDVLLRSRAQIALRMLTRGHAGALPEIARDSGFGDVILMESAVRSYTGFSLLEILQSARRLRGLDDAVS